MYLCSTIIAYSIQLCHFLMVMQNDGNRGLDGVKSEMTLAYTDVRFVFVY